MADTATALDRWSDDLTTGFTEPEIRVIRQLMKAHAVLLAELVAAAHSDEATASRIPTDRAATSTNCGTT